MIWGRVNLRNAVLGVRFEWACRTFWHARSYGFNVWAAKKRSRSCAVWIGTQRTADWSSRRSSYCFYLLDERAVRINVRWEKISFRDDVA